MEAITVNNNCQVIFEIRSVFIPNGYLLPAIESVMNNIFWADVDAGTAEDAFGVFHAFIQDRLQDFERPGISTKMIYKIVNALGYVIDSMSSKSSFINEWLLERLILSDNCPPNPF